MNKQQIAKILKAWGALNDVLRDADETLCEELLCAELEGAGRKQFMLRIHSRLNRMRAGAERIKLKGSVKHQ